ncbi:hypothetical protein HPB50_018750 [Hyalomma asiaticum]|uniref:Uncharacterized protein n=1 Tax=Hyalomma asiaticum TaxID=266040 RepID=A0ACB7S4N7_HYAAI|nr:hypothetical protein HPB50_018750 [Hyalomma asiaticum]
MAESRPSAAEEPADGGPPSPGAASHSDGSVFSDEGDKTIIALDYPYNIPPVLDNVGHCYLGNMLRSAGLLLDCSGFLALQSRNSTCSTPISRTVKNFACRRRGNASWLIDFDCAAPNGVSDSSRLTLESWPSDWRPEAPSFPTLDGNDFIVWQHSSSVTMAGLRSTVYKRGGRDTSRAVGTPESTAVCEEGANSSTSEQWPQLAQDADVKASVNKDTQVSPDDADADKPESMDLSGAPVKRPHEDAEETATRPVGEGQPPSKTAPHRRTPYRPRSKRATSRSAAETPPSAPT